ncbi:uncharacterized protein LOC133824288 [Humulus lupulus]|uniref:uncharacterized protein LOC133824288 n=1 Tax=Humulus lupulus TaxID=3486 RepID=UPI002B40F7B8|nr:uncharacterized protein LOC133824288 [Humulus lupulus]XP_062113149.1 uncharacterized protein LOC133824288 [Humulus lupulus]XP_062113150.1 uncharacterized protein LOC133824288 [Humulus lupulus]XP_062113151.1 uncharacterized protein LOC133824288 [Humulus lupulus]XP_062113152.1 uncharacterized protein LOC133824288 [Humulus lupulus]
MSGKASSSHSNVGLNGSGALSHVYIQYPPLRSSISGAKGLFYDDGSKLLISPTSDQVFSWKTVPFVPSVSPACDSISEGPILSIRYSLDGKFIAILRSSREIQFWHRESKETFSQRCRPESESILGFFWTDCPLCDIVLVKTSGLDLLTYNSESKSLQLVETRKLNVSWYVYTHESRLLLLASGMQCKTFNGFQLSSAGIIRLPKFEMVMAKSDANNKPVLAAEDIFIVTVYGRIYCLQVDRVAMLLHSYRFYRDAVVQQGSLPIYSSRVAVSAVDNVLLVHQIDAKVVILYDVFTDSRAPISAPLPLLLRGLHRSNSYSLRSHREDNESSEDSAINGHEVVIYGDDWTFLVPDLICDVANQFLWKIHIDLEAISASSSDVPAVIEFLQRRKLDASKGKQLCLSIACTAILEHRPVSMVAKAINVLVTSYSHSIKTGCCVKTTKSEKTSASGVPHVTSPRPNVDESISRVDALGKSVKHDSTAGDNEPSNRSAAFSNSDSDDSVNSESARTNSNGLQTIDSKVDKRRLMGGETSSVAVMPSAVGFANNSLIANTDDHQESQITSPAISPDEIYRFVFAPVEEEMVGDPSYLIAIIVEFLHSAILEKVKVHPNLYVLMIQLLARGERYAELSLFVVNKILEPSKEVAMQLLESGRQNPQTRKLGLGMLRQLALHHDYVLSLVQDGYYLEALRYARKHKVDTVRPSLFLETALASNDSQNVAAVLRFFSDFIPGFRTTSDHSTYYRILKEMNSTVAA